MRRLRVATVLAACALAGVAAAAARRPVAPRRDVDAEAREYVAACEREHRAWCRECEP